MLPSTFYVQVFMWTHKVNENGELLLHLGEVWA